MTILPVVTVIEIQGGVAARATEIGLAGHGRDRERAMAALRSVVNTWARCLDSDGELERALARRGVAVTASGDGLDIDFEVDPITD